MKVDRLLDTGCDGIGRGPRCSAWTQRRRLLNKTEGKPEDVDWYVYHQANKYMLEHLAKRSAIPEEKMVVDVESLGNTVSASIPIAIRRLQEAGRLKIGDRLVLVGFGVGYSWGACEIVWGATC